MILTGKLNLLAFLMCLSFLGMSQTGTLRGKVKDLETGETLPGASVLIVGTYKVATTDFDGNYAIKEIKPGDYSIKIQSMGYGTKVFNDITINPSKSTVLDVKLSTAKEVLQSITVVGRKSQVDLEKASSEITFGKEEIENLNVRDVTELISLQAGVTKTQDGLQIRGARVYETEYIVDGVSAQDPLAGTGFGVNVAASSVQQLELITGGAGAEYGGGSSGVINTQIREAGDKFAISGSWQRDFFGSANEATSFNTDIAELSIGLPIPGTKKKLTLFGNATMNINDTYFGSEANQLNSSLVGNSQTWGVRQTNSFTNTFKLGWAVKPGVKVTITNQHSLNINQNSRSLQIVGFDAILTPGFQYNRSNNLDNATTYTHQSNLLAINYSQLINTKWGINLSAGHLFTNLRADANGRPFREESVSQIYDEDNINQYPIGIFNPDDPFGIIYTLPGDGLVNNGGITPIWHDHYAEEYTLKAKANYFPNKTHEFSFGLEHVFQEYQWADVSRPWVGAPIKLDDSTFTPSISVGSSNDIWFVQPQKGGLYVQDKISYQGIIATIGLRMNYWAAGSFADNAVEDPNSPVIDQVRSDYIEKTTKIGGLRWKARLLPRLNVSFPVTANNVLYFSYGHAMRTPHPRFLYAGLNPEYLDQSFLSNLGNPDIDPEVNVSYEIGFKTLISSDIGLSIAAYNNNRFDYIVSRRVIVTDQTGRPVTKTMYINQDYAKITGIETTLNWRIGKHFNTFANVGYQVARGKSNSARESSLQIEQNGEVALTSEQYLAWDRPWKIGAGVIFNPDTSLKKLHGLRIFWNFNYTSGFRYTPQVKIGENDLGRPIYQQDISRYLQGKATPWFNSDFKASYTVGLGKSGNGLVFSFEIRNLFDNKNAQIINPVTGRAYEYGDDVPTDWRDPRPEYNGPQEQGVDPRNPARYLAPRQVLWGIAVKF
jgi:outer membrane receptor protein involved in Fe transport